MAIPEGLNDREHRKFKESVSAPGQPAVAIVNPDGTNIGGSGGTSMTDNTAYVQGASSLTPTGFLGDDAPDALGANERVGIPRMRRTTRVQFVEQLDASGNPVTRAGAATIANTQVDVDTTAGGVEVVAARATRRAVTIINLGTTDVWVGAGTVSATNGQLLLGVKGTAMTIETTAQVKAIATSGTQRVSALEEYD